MTGCRLSHILEAFVTPGRGYGHIFALKGIGDNRFCITGIVL